MRETTLRSYPAASGGAKSYGTGLREQPVTWTEEGHAAPQPAGGVDFTGAQTHGRHARGAPEPEPEPPQGTSTHVSNCVTLGK